MGTITLSLAQLISLDLALVLSVVTARSSVAWYMNINAEASAISPARDHLIERINHRNNSAKYERTIYADIVGRAGSNAKGTTWMVTLMIIAYLGFIVLGIYWSLDPPAGLSAQRGLGTPWRQTLQIAISLACLRAVVAALTENVRYRERIGDAIRNDAYSSVRGTELAGSSRCTGWIGQLSSFTKNRGTAK